MGLFDKLGSKIVADKIKAEAKNAIDRYVETTAVQSVLPQTQDGDAAQMAVKADIRVLLKSAHVEYTEHMGKDKPNSLDLESEDKMLNLNTVVRALRPRLLANSEALTAEKFTVAFQGRIAGIGMKQLFMGVGATIDAITVDLVLECSVNAQWLNQPQIESAEK